MGSHVGHNIQKKNLDKSVFQKLLRKENYAQTLVRGYINVHPKNYDPLNLYKQGRLRFLISLFFSGGKVPKSQGKHQKRTREVQVLVQFKKATAGSLQSRRQGTCRKHKKKREKRRPIGTELFWPLRNRENQQIRSLLTWHKGVCCHPQAEALSRQNE